MHDNNLISQSFNNIKNNRKIIENIYTDDDFMNFYNKSSQKSIHTFNDIELFEKYIDSEKTILEIGSGTGRVIKELSQKNYYIYGIEPIEKLYENLDINIKKKIFPLYLQEIKKLPIDNIDIIIIPATTISLFDEKTIFKFFEDIDNKFENPSFKIYFDIINRDRFLKDNNIIYKEKIDGTTYFYTNFINDNKIIMNIANDKKIGVSKKNLYDVSFFESIARKYNYSFDILFHRDSYHLIKLERKKNQ